MRLTFDIEQKTWESLSKHLKHGQRKYIYKSLIEGFVSQLEDNPQRTLAQVVTKQWDLGDWLQEPKSETINP